MIALAALSVFAACYALYFCYCCCFKVRLRGAKDGDIKKPAEVNPDPLPAAPKSVEELRDKAIADIEAENARLAAEEAERMRQAAEEAERVRQASEEAERVRAKAAEEEKEAARLRAEAEEKEKEAARLRTDEEEKVRGRAEEIEKEAAQQRIEAEEREKEAARLRAEQAEKEAKAAEIASLESLERGKQAQLDYMQGIKTFTFELLQKRIVDWAANNDLISPLGISILLSMIKHGVGLKDRTEIEKFIHLPRDVDELKGKIYELIQKLKSNGLDIANILYLHNKYRLNPQCQDLISHYYQSLVKTGSNEGPVNEYIREKTNGYIQGSIGHDDVFKFNVLLANAIHFRAAWSHPFNPLENRQADFVKLDHTTVKVNMMHQTGEFEYFEDLDCRAIKLPYNSGDKSNFLLLILPTRDYKFLFMSAFKFDDILKNPDKLTREKVKLSLPKFSFDYKIDVKKLLKGLRTGMDEVIDRPDFSSLLDQTHTPSKKALRELSINAISQQTSFSCDEMGSETRAVAPTERVREEKETESLVHTKELNFDRPFLAVLVSEGIPVLLGLVKDPTAE